MYRDPHHYHYEKLEDILAKHGKELEDLPAYEREIFNTIYDKLVTAGDACLCDGYAEKCMELLLRAWDNHIRINSGMPESWAAGLLHAASKTRPVRIHVSGESLKYRDVSKLFGVSCMTVSNQSKKIQQYLAAG